MDSEWLKSIFLPSNLFTILLLAAMLLLALRRRVKWGAVGGWAIGGFALLMYFILASGPVAHFLLSRLEYRYPAFPLTKPALDIHYIVVLTGDAEIRPQISLSSYPNSSSAFRLLEAARLHQMYPQAPILISGGSWVPSLLKDVLVSMGIPASAIELDNQSYNTFSSAANLAALLQGEPFALVTSAGHMPRAMAVFEAQNLRPVPAPTEFLSRKNILAAQYLPTPHHLLYVDLAVHEYLALLWYRTSGRI